MSLKKDLKKLSHKKLVKVCIEAIEAANCIAQQAENHKNRGDAATEVLAKVRSELGYKTELLARISK